MNQKTLHQIKTKPRRAKALRMNVRLKKRRFPQEKTAPVSDVIDL